MQGSFFFVRTTIFTQSYKMHKLTLYKKGIFAILLILLCFSTNAQNNSKLNKSKQGVDLIKDSAKAENMDTATSAILAKIEDLSVTIGKLQNIMRRGYQVKEYIGDLSSIERTLHFMDSVLSSGSTIAEVNLRNISSFKVIAMQFDKSLNNWKSEFENYNEKINSSFLQIAEKRNQPLFQKLLKDSILQVQYVTQLNYLDRNVEILKAKRDSIFRNIATFESRVAKAFIQNGELTEEIQYRIFLYSKTLFGKTHKYLWEDDGIIYETPLLIDIKTAIIRATHFFNFFVENNLPLLLFTFGLSCLFLLWVLSTIRILKKKKLDSVLSPLRFLGKSPIAACFLLLFIIYPFVFSMPPAVFVELMWFIAGIIATIFIWKHDKNISRFIWLIILFLFIYFGIDNLLYAYSLEERYALLIGNVIALVIGWIIIKGNSFDPYKKNWIFRWSFFIFISANALSAIFNIFGHFAFSKLLANTSVLQLVLAVSLNQLSEIFTEIIFIQLEKNKDTSYAVYMEFDNIRKKFKSFLNLAAIIVWVMGFLWSLSFLSTIQQYFNEFLSAKISIGNFSFTPGSALIFSITLLISVLASNFIAILFGSSEQQFASTKKSKIGSWMMLLRLGVISSGFLIAVAAAGIPVDKLAIVFGALSVGIGFGLQNVVGNLVSGIILAFEKPMQIGDVIEIGNQNGTVKHIGIRSSKITTFDGAEIIVPNGDFITQKLTNWTHTNQFRRIELLIGVAYGSSVEKVSDLIMEMIVKQPNVMSYPKPLVLVHEFADSSINFRVLFWTRDYESWIELKSDTLSDIYNIFAENGITIPFPQQDLHIKQIPEKDT